MLLYAINVRIFDQNLDWRKKNGMDSILDEDFSDMESDYKYFIDGFDYQGRPGIEYEFDYLQSLEKLNRK